MRLYSRRAFTLTGASLTTMASLPVFAQSGFPNRPVKLYVGASAGGGPDATARSIADGLKPVWGQSVVVDNRPGAAGVLAAELTAQAAPDGHTLCLLLDSVLTTVPFVTDKMPVDPLKDLKPIAMVGGFPMVLVANPSVVKYRNLREFAAEARDKPGKIDYASSGVGGPGHLAMETFSGMTGISVNHVAYKGGLPALQDVLAGHIPLMWSSIFAALPSLQSGRLVALGIGSSDRFPLAAGVPTAIEQGYAGFTAGNWLGVFGPAGLSDALTQRIHDDLEKLAANPAYRDALLAQGTRVTSMPASDFARTIRSEYERNKALFARLNISK